MLKEPIKHTEKVFEEYNDYHDRGMVKWVTAFAMEELTRSISTGKEEALKDIPILPQMNAFEINEVLVEALKKSHPVSVQLNRKDRFGRQTESIVGHFRGYLAENKILIDNEWILPESIRNVQVLQEDKWFKVDSFKQNQRKTDEKKPNRGAQTTFDTEKQEVLETEITWFEDFNQSETWFD